MRERQTWMRGAGPMDAALNSLTSPGMVAATLACLGRHAWLSEISKRDIWSPQRVAQERPDVGYKLVAIDFLPPQVRINKLQIINHQENKILGKF